MTYNIFLSKQMDRRLRELFPSSQNLAHSVPYHIPVMESSLFPFQIYYDACDIKTKQEISVASGEWVHGAIIPQHNIETQPTLFDFSLDTHKSPLRSFMERNWGMEIFKF